MRRHPKNPWITNNVAARTLIFMTRHRLPVVNRLLRDLLGCDIGLALPKTVSPFLPMGIAVCSGTRIGDDVVILSNQPARRGSRSEEPEHSGRLRDCVA